MLNKMTFFEGLLYLFRNNNNTKQLSPLHALNYINEYATLYGGISVCRLNTELLENLLSFERKKLKFLSLMHSHLESLMLNIPGTKFGLSSEEYPMFPPVFLSWGIIKGGRMSSQYFFFSLIIIVVVNFTLDSVLLSYFRFYLLVLVTSPQLIKLK